MKVLVKFFVFDLPPGFADAEFDMGKSAIVNDVFDKCLELFKQRGAAMDENELRTATVLIGDKWADADAAVSDGDTLTIIRPMDGG
jgi:molybdopterin converting factor small subunit